MSLRSGRVCAAEETERRVRKILRRIPVTRISDLTPLDRLGLPTYSVTTPLARDLTTHLGKGGDAVSARVSALMEAVERVSAEDAPADAVLRASLEDLRRQGKEALDPSLFDLPAESAWHPRKTVTWIRSELLKPQQTPRAVLLPADLALSPPREGILQAVDTNGLAAGNTLSEAVVHGLCEVIERDAQGQLEFQTLFGDPNDHRPAVPAVDGRTLPEDARRWALRIEEAGLSLMIHDLTGDVRVPGFRALIFDPAFPTDDGIAPMIFAGWGTSLSASAAVLRAITEAVQSRLGFIQGARDAWNTTSEQRRPATLKARLRPLCGDWLVAFDQTRAVGASSELADPVRILPVLQGRLAEVGLDRIVVTDLTRPDLDLPVVRVRVPGLSSFLVNQRRVGWRCLRHLL